MNKILSIVILSGLFQTTVYAENDQATDQINSTEPDSTIITPDVGSQYNLEGMQNRDGKYKSSYSTDTVEKRRVSPNTPSPYGANGSAIPVAPLIIITDE